VMAYQAEMISTQPQVTITNYTITTGSSDWSSNLCDCCDDCGILCVCVMGKKVISSDCLCGTFIPCILGCKIAQDHGDTCCLPFLPGAMIALRTSIRDKYRIN
ncbi:hypothetical protein P4O66_010562, partial [Electrophorus voltai]